MTANDPPVGDQAALREASRQLRELMRRLSITSAAAAHAAARIASGLRTIAGCLETMAASIDTLAVGTSPEKATQAEQTAMFALLAGGPAGRDRAWAYPRLDNPSLS